MLKKYLLVLMAAGLISIAVPFAAAQDSPSNDQQAPPPQENGMRHHGPPDPARRTAELTRRLKLTSDQQTKVQAALQSERSQMESVHQDLSLIHIYNEENSEEQRNANDQREELLRFRMQHEPNRADNGDGEQQEVDEVLSFISDRPLWQDFLQLSGRHQAAGEGQASEDYFHREHRHHEFGNIWGAQIKLCRTDQGNAQRAEGVAESLSLIHI